LHVLSLPPAFALSQDQTLKLDENSIRQITTFDEVPPPPHFKMLHPTSRPARQNTQRTEIGVDLKRVPPKSRPPLNDNQTRRSRNKPNQRQTAARTPPSTFLFLPIHLSNSIGGQNLQEARLGRGKTPPPSLDNPSG
jgi:hypothetical protein